MALDPVGHATLVCRDGPDSPCGGSRCMTCGCCNCCGITDGQLDPCVVDCPCSAHPGDCSCAEAQLFTPIDTGDGQNGDG